MLRLLLSTFILLSTSATSEPNIVVSINPIHSLVGNITKGITTPKLLLTNNQSAHHTHLKPSQLSLIENADLIIAIHPKMEQGLNKALRNINKGKKLYVYQAEQDHSDEHDEHDEHGHDNENYHIWLDINQMQNFAKNLSTKLGLIDPANQAIYQKNYILLNAKLKILKKNTKDTLANSKQPIANYSNAFEHFINTNQLNQKTLITSKHEERLSLHKIIKAKKSMQTNQVKCLLSTVSVPEKRIKVLTEGLKINTAKIDILGREFNPDNDQYFKLMNSITNKVEQCLK